jgi:four helix bundle protein
MALVVPVHRLVLSFPDYEKYALSDQIRRASRSVPTNIVEGYSRRSSAREFRHYLGISMGSANEMIVHLEVTVQLEYAAGAICQPWIEQYESIGKQIHMLIAHWRSDGRLPASSR